MNKLLSSLGAIVVGITAFSAQAADSVIVPNPIIRVSDKNPIHVGMFEVRAYGSTGNGGSGDTLSAREAACYVQQVERLKAWNSDPALRRTLREISEDIGRPLDAKNPGTLMTIQLLPSRDDAEDMGYHPKLQERFGWIREISMRPAGRSAAQDGSCDLISLDDLKGYLDGIQGQREAARADRLKSEMARRQAAADAQAKGAAQDAYNRGLSDLDTSPKPAAINH